MLNVHVDLADGHQDLFCSVTSFGARGPLSDDVVNLCMKKCMLSPEPDCIAVKLGHSDGRCQTLDSDLANDAMVNLDEANELLIFPRTCEYKT